MSHIKKNSTNTFITLKGKFVKRPFSSVHIECCSVQLNLWKERTDGE